MGAETQYTVVRVTSVSAQLLPDGRVVSHIGLWKLDGDTAWHPAISPDESPGANLTLTVLDPNDAAKFVIGRTFRFALAPDVPDGGRER